MVEKASSLPGIVNQEGKIAGSGKDGKKGKYYGRRKIEERLERVMGRPQSTNEKLQEDSKGLKDVERAPTYGREVHHWVGSCLAAGKWSHSWSSRIPDNKPHFSFTTEISAAPSVEARSPSRNHGAY